MSPEFDQLMASLCVAACAPVPVLAVPYAQFLGLDAGVVDNQLVVRMPFALQLVGQPQPQRLHGGVIAGLLEFTGAMTIARALAMQAASGSAPALPRPLNISLDYLRAGGPADTFASADIMRIGRRIANVRAQAWQGTPDRLISAAHMNMVLGQPR